MPPTLSPQDIVVVSGLPRSGTSLMMQMLEAGGIPPLSDGLRDADDSNPRGYYEYAPVKSLRTNSAWLVSARGRAVKIILQLLPYLAEEHRYWIIEMQRPVTEVIASQRTMLSKTNKAGALLSDTVLAQAYERQIIQVHDWLDQRREIHRLELSHGETISDPQAAADRVADFLGIDMKRDVMAAIVDPNLHRSRLNAPEAPRA